MLDQVKRWLLLDEEVSDIQALASWSRQQGWGFRRLRTGAGFTVDATSAGNRWRMDWGPSERSYIVGNELRLRMDLGLPPDLQLLVMNRVLAESLETVAFEKCTQSLQTVIDTSMPEEIRWLSMFPRVNLASLGDVESGYGAWSIAPSLALWWMDGELSEALLELARDWLPEYTPFVLMTQRGRLYLRAHLPAPSLDLIIHLRRVFLIAAEHAIRVASLEPLDLRDRVEFYPPSSKFGTWSSTLGKQASVDEV